MPSTSTQSTVKASNFVTLLDENIFFLQTFLRTPHDFFGIEICTDGTYALFEAFWSYTMLRPQKFIFLWGDEIRRPSSNFVTPWSFLSYNDHFKHRMFMSSLFLWWKNSLNPQEANDTLHGSIGCLRWHREEKYIKFANSKIFLFQKWAWINNIQKLKPHMSLEMWLLDTYNHYVTYFWNFLK